MNGGQHFFIGAVTAGAGLWGARYLGLELETGTILAGALVAGVGSLAPDIDHPRATISRGLPGELLRRSLPVLLLALMLVALPALLGDVEGAARKLGSLAQTPWLEFFLLLASAAVGLKVISIIISALFGHRGATHSLVFALAATLIVTGVCLELRVGGWYGLLFGWGWLMHLLADASTEVGLPALWWPLAGGKG